MVTTPYNRRKKIHTSQSAEERLTAVEAAVEHIELNINTLTNTIKDGFSDLHTRIDKQNDDNRPHVLAWAGWATVIILIIGMIGSVYVKDLQRVEANLMSSNSELREEISDKYKDTIARLTKLEDRCYTNTQQVSKNTAIIQRGKQ